MKSNISKMLVLGIVACVFAAMIYGCGVRPIDPTVSTGEETEDTPVSSQMVRIPDGEVSVATVEVPEGGAIKVLEEDCQNIFDVYRLPALERMVEEDRDVFVESLMSVKKAKSAIDFELSMLGYPEYNYKVLYNAVREEIDGIVRDAEVEFWGTSASELNSFIASNSGSSIKVKASEISVDEPIVITDGVCLDGGGCRLVASGSDRAIEISGVEGVAVLNFVIDDENFEYGIFVESSNDFVISGNEISNISGRAMPILRECSNFVVENNRVHHNAHGGIFVNGESHDGIFEANSVSYNEGSTNSMPGLFIGDHQLVEEDSAKTEFWEPDQAELKSGHDLVIIDNSFDHNRSQGIYSHSGYANYFVSNTVAYNHKEGTCLDYGTSCCYVSGNLYTANGEREGVDDGEPSYNKLPGISLDNACYNIIRNNVFSYNGGSGIKAVRASCRNVIIDNSVVSNNRGQSDDGHFFAIELASDMSKDYEEAAGLDFAPCFENIIARNTIDGAHYSGIFLGGDDYANDVFNNVIMGCTVYSIECRSAKFNSVVDNIVDAPEFYDGVTIPPVPEDESEDGSGDAEPAE